jgi:hypothetical protein
MRHRDRAALLYFALVVIAVVLYAIDEDGMRRYSRVQRIALESQYLRTEPSNVTFCLWEYVPVSRPTPHVQVALLINDFRNIFSGNPDGSRVPYCFRPQRYWSWLRISKVWIRKIVGEGILGRNPTKVGRHISGRSSAVIFPRNRKVQRSNLRSIVWVNDSSNIQSGRENKSTLNTDKGIFGGLRQVFCISGKESSLSSLCSGIDCQRVHFVNLPLHFSESLLKGRIVTVQGSGSQIVGVSDLQPLEAGKPRISEQEHDTEYLKANFGVFAPLAGVIVGGCGCGWGLWRVRRGSSWRHLWWGFASLFVGFGLASVAGVVFMLVAF